MQKWLSRAAFSFIILAAVLAWESYRMIVSKAPVQTRKLVLACVGTGVFAALGVAGIRSRHNELK